MLQALGRLANDLAIDLGTSTTLVFVRGQGIVVEEPSVVAVRQAGQVAQVVAVGAEAKQMLGRTPDNLVADCPIRDGHIHDYALAEALLHDCVHRALTTTSPLLKPRMIICMPQSITDVERRALTEAAKNAGAREVHLVPHPIAAALGAGLAIHTPTAKLILDIGGGTTEAGMVSVGGLVDVETVEAGGLAMDMAIQAWLDTQMGLTVSPRTAEQIKLTVGTATDAIEPQTMRLAGQDRATGIPREFSISGNDVARAIAPVLAQIAGCLHTLVSRLSPELSADVLTEGVVLCGGAATLPGLPAYLEARSGLKIRLTENPHRCVALGAGKLLEDEATLARFQA